MSLVSSLNGLHCTAGGKPCLHLQPPSSNSQFLDGNIQLFQINEEFFKMSFVWCLNEVGDSSGHQKIGFEFSLELLQ